MKTFTAVMISLSLVWLAGCQARPSAGTDAAALKAQLQADQAKIAAISQQADRAAAAQAAAEKRVADLSTQLDSAKTQLAAEQQNAVALKQQLAAAKQAKSAADEQASRAVAENDALKGKLSPGGTLHAIDDSAPAGPVAAGNGSVPDEIRTAFQNGLAWRANIIQSLEIEIRDTPSKVEARSLKAQIDKLNKAPVVPPPLHPADLTVGQIGPLEIDNYLRVDAVVGDNTVVVTPIKVDPSLSPQNSQAGAGSAAPGAGSGYAVEGEPIALHGFATKGLAVGGKITTLPGFFYVEKTESYGGRTVFVLAPVDASKLRSYFNRLQSEMRSAAKSKQSIGSDAVAK